MDLEPGEARLVSFTVDPEFDTPAILQTYSRQWSTNPENWFFLTSAEPQDMHQVAAGFKVAAAGGTGESGETPPEIIHGTHIFVVDSRGMIRAFVDSSAPDSSKRVLRLIRQVEKLERLD